MTKLKKKKKKKEEWSKLFLRDLKNGMFNMVNLNSSKYKTSKQNF